MRTSRLRYAAAAALTTGLLVPIAVFAGPGFAHGSASAAEYQYGGGTGGKAGKVTICHHAGPHKTITITVSRNSLKGHKKHGDTEGACPTTPTTSAPTAAAPTSHHEDADDNDGGNGGGHGKSQGKGNGHK